MKKNQLAEIKRLIQERRLLQQSYCAVTHFLVTKGVSKTLAEEIGLELTCQQNELRHLKESLQKRIHTKPEIPVSASRQMALVGPTGVGKTTTILKLANYYQQLGKKVEIVCLDRIKGGAFSQLEEYVEKKGIALHKDFYKLGLYDLLLVDTAGVNFYQPNQVDKIGEELAQRGEIEILLTLSLATKEVDLCGAIHQFSALGLSGLTFTKLDETLSPGVLLNICAKTDLPIRYVSCGYPLPGEIWPGDKEWITHKILVDLNEEVFQKLRNLTVE